MKNSIKKYFRVASVLKTRTAAILLTAILLGCSSPSHQQTWAKGKPKHHTVDGFRNYPLVPELPSAGIGFYLRRFWGSFVFPDVPPDHYLSEKNAIEGYQKMKGQNTITWLGHATFLIRINGITILTDPFLTDNASPYRYLGAQRFVPPGITLDNLPPIDVLLVSHNHYDHLDAETVESLDGKAKIRVFVPLGLKPFFSKRGYQTITELDWHEGATLKDIRFTALPAVHYSRRGTNDKNKTLWCSWSISSTFGKYYFSGDTSYSPSIFKDIGRRDGPFDLAMISIGAYKIRDHGPKSHLTPEQAVQVALEIKSDTVVGMHWGTIELSDEPHFEPPIRFMQAAKKNAISPDQTWIMKIGETRLLPSS